MTDEGWGFADIYAMDERPDRAGEPADVQGDDWRNILVLGRATRTGVYPETLALVGRARYMADELGCRVEVLLVGEDLEPATEVLRRYPIDTVYRVPGPDYAPIDHAAKVLEAVVKKRRPELVMAFQSRTGDAVVGYTANRLGVGFVVGATDLRVDTGERRFVAVHPASQARFLVTTAFVEAPQFVSVQRGLFRAPMEDPYASVRVHDLAIDPGRVAAVTVRERQPPPEPGLETAERVVVCGARVSSREDVAAARGLADRLGARFGVTRSVLDRGLVDDEDLLVGVRDHHIQPRLLVCVGVRGSLDVTEAIRGNPTVCAVGNEDGDPLLRRATYHVRGAVGDAVAALLDALELGT